VDDLIEGMIRMMEVEGFTGPVNLGNPEEYSMVELAQRIIQMTASSSKIVHLADADHDPKQRRPDIALAKQRLQWEPKILLQEGLQKTIDFFRATL
jgi:UDP-glucuronate decarboxylase